VSDMQNYQTDEKFDVIVFNEVLYYLTLEIAEREFLRYAQFLSPGGLIIVSLKKDEISGMILKLLCKHHERIFGIIFQPQPQVPSWKITYTSQTPAILVSAFRPCDGNAHK
jgi:hypothetical protein